MNCKKNVFDKVILTSLIISNYRCIPIFFPHNKSYVKQRNHLRLLAPAVANAIIQNGVPTRLSTKQFGGRAVSFCPPPDSGCDTQLTLSVTRDASSCGDTSRTSACVLTLDGDVAQQELGLFSALENNKMPFDAEVFILHLSKLVYYNKYQKQFWYLRYCKYVLTSSILYASMNQKCNNVLGLPCEEPTSAETPHRE